MCCPLLAHSVSTSGGCIFKTKFIFKFGILNSVKPPELAVEAQCHSATAED